MKVLKEGILLLHFLPLTIAVSEIDTIKGSCGGWLETNMTYSGRTVWSKRFGPRRNTQGRGNATDCSLQCGQTDECQYWTFLLKVRQAWYQSPCKFFSTLTKKSSGGAGRVSGRRPCRANELSVTVGSQMVEATEGATITMTCSSSDDIDTCIFTTPRNAFINTRAPGATYDNGRIDVLEKRPDSCGIKITGVEQVDFGAWKCKIRAYVDGFLKEGFNTFTLTTGPCGSQTEKGVGYVTYSANYLSTSMAPTADTCADFCWELAECRNQDTKVISGQRPCGKRGTMPRGLDKSWRTNSLPAGSCGTKEKGVRYGGYGRLESSKTKVDPKNDTEACVNLCNQHIDCQFWRHDSSDGECYLYTSLTRKDNSTSYTSGRRSCSPKELSVTVKSSMIAVEVGKPADLWCSHNAWGWQSTTDPCTFTTPGNSTLVIAPGAAYQEGRLEVLDGWHNSCGLRIARVEEADFGVWRCSLTASWYGLRKEGANSVILVGSCGSLTEKNTLFVTFSNEYFTTSKNSTPLDCANLCFELSRCRYWSHTHPSTCKLFPNVDIINRGQGDNATAGQKPCSKLVLAVSATSHYAILGGTAAAMFIVIAAASGCFLWSRRRKARTPVEEPRELEVWRVGPSEPRNEPENYYATMRPGTWKATATATAHDDSDYIYENEIYTTMPPAARAATRQPESDYEGTYIYAN